MRLSYKANINIRKSSSGNGQKLKAESDFQLLADKHYNKTWLTMIYCTNIQNIESNFVCEYIYIYNASFRMHGGRHVVQTYVIHIHFVYLYTYMLLRTYIYMYLDTYSGCLYLSFSH